MLTRVCLASREIPWSFEGSHRLSTWVDTALSGQESNVLAIRVSGPRQAELLSAAVVTMVYAAGAGGSDVQIRLLGSEVPVRTASGVLRDALEVELSAGADQRRDIERVADELSIRQRVLAVDATGWTRTEAKRTFDALAALGTSACKLEHGAALSAMVMHQAPLWADALEAAVDVGGPAVSVTEALVSSPSVLWSAYLHHRLAWEAGGDLDRALGWNDTLAQSARSYGDDDAFESQLGALSTAALTPELRSAVLAYLRASPKDPTQARVRRELEQQRALWSPSGVTRVVPWIARAILLADPTPLLRAQLRWGLVCAPLRRDLLALCLELEGAARATHARDVGDPPESARDDWDTFRARRPGSDARFYPAESPATPEGPLAFAELGAFLTALRAGPARATMLHRLRLLRNYLAHGHYISWACVKEISEIVQSLSG